jgi:hypothetical protein
MPHTSHRKGKEKYRKRQEIVDKDGWTQVTTSKSSTRPVVKLAAAKVEQQRQETQGTLPKSMPAVKGATFKSMQAQYTHVEERWLQSELCKTLIDLLTIRCAGKTVQIASCIVFGTGSFCGDALHWIDRHESAFFQLAAFQTVLRTVEEVHGSRPPAYAQEPCYNQLDTAFLRSLSIEVVAHPEGFDALAENSFVYSPAAEAQVEVQILTRSPAIWLHRTLERRDEAQDDIKLFAEAYEHSVLPEYAVKNLPFHKSVLWWKADASLGD